MSETQILDGVVIGAVGGFLAGITVYFAQFLHTKYLEWSQKDRVYKWMRNLLTQNREGIKYLSTRYIASHNNLTEDRARYICSIHDEIYLSVGDKEDMWGLKDISGRV